MIAQNKILVGRLFVLKHVKTMTMSGVSTRDI